MLAERELVNAVQWQHLYRGLKFTKDHSIRQLA